MDFERVEIGPCTLYRGDAFKVMAAADFVADAVITDPPYAKGYARHQAEYIVWATKGHCPIAKHGGPWPGVYRHPVLQRDKHHMVGKPTPLLEELVQWVEPGGIVFDPFMGSGTAGVAAINQGRRFVGCEIDDHYFEVARARIQAAYDAAQREAA